MKVDKALASQVEDYVSLNIKITEYISERDLGTITNERVECPFHADATPSMYVSTEKNIFKCFSCGKGGGIVSFHQNYMNEVEGKKLNYYTAIDDLIKRYPVIRYDTGIDSVIEDENKKIDFTQPVELTKRFSLRDRRIPDSVTIKQVVNNLRKRNNKDEIISFINDCMNECEERVLITKYENDNTNSMGTAKKEGLTIFDLIGED